MTQSDTQIIGDNTDGGNDNEDDEDDDGPNLGLILGLTIPLGTIAILLIAVLVIYNQGLIKGQNQNNEPAYVVDQSDKAINHEGYL